MLFIPAGCLLTVTVSRTWITIFSLSVFSLLIEVVQRATRLGVADVSDLLANIAGTAAGAVLAVVVLHNDRILEARESVALASRTEDATR